MASPARVSFTRMATSASIALLTMCAGAHAQLTQTEVETILRQAIARADTVVTGGINATISVVDQEGNVLGCIRMTNTVGAAAGRTVPFTSVVFGGGVGDLEGGFVNDINFPADSLAVGVPPADYLILPASRGASVATSITATSKAGTAAFLSTAGNAFTTRTAAFIVQSQFPPKARLQPSGPLFGVQLSSLPTSDLNRLPLGLSADSGGLPLYKVGVDGFPVCVGGVGVETNDTRTAASGTYGIDTIKTRGTASNEEKIALAGQAGFTPPRNVRADRILVAGIRFPYAYTRDAVAPVLAVNPTFFTDEAGAGRLQIIAAPAAGGATQFITTPLSNPVTGEVYDFYPEQPGIQNGETFPGYSAAGVLQTFAGVANGGQNLTATDVQVILANAHEVCNRLRAMIRRDTPLRCQVNVSVVDFDGNLIGFYRSPDAPVFGADVSLQKGRSALFFSRADCASILAGLEADGTTTFAQLFDADGAGVGVGPYQKYATAAAAQGLLLDGSVAIAERTIGAISRENLPDGIPNRRNGASPVGPLSTFGLLPAATTGGASNRFSVFNTGIQTDLIMTNIVTYLLTYGPGGGPTEAVNLATFGTNRTGNRPLATGPLAGVPGRVTVGSPDVAAPNGLPARTLANGLQIFPGGVPLYKNGVLVGGIGISGDGIEQDDTVAFAGAGGFRAGLAGQDFQQFGTAAFPGSPRRADFFVLTGPGTLRLPYIKIPRAPFQGLRPL